MTPKLRITPMDVLEVLMWTGGFSTILALWLVWPSFADKPARGVVVSREATSVIPFSSQVNRAPQSRGLTQFEERAGQAMGHTGLTTSPHGLSNDWPSYTGSSSLAREATTVARFSVTASSNLTGEAEPVGSGSAPPALAVALSEPPGGRPDLKQESTDVPVPNVDSSDGALPDRSRFVQDDVPVAVALASPDAALLERTQPASIRIYPANSMEMNSAASGGTLDQSEETPAKADAELLYIAVPEVELVLDEIATAVGSQAPAEAARDLETHSASVAATMLPQVPLAVLVEKGEEMLARGDVSGARLFFQRAAESGDASAAMGMGRTFDAKVLRSMSVYGVRPDPEQAAHWYARSKALERVAATR